MMQSNAPPNSTALNSGFAAFPAWQCTDATHSEDFIGILSGDLDSRWDIIVFMLHTGWNWDDVTGKQNAYSIQVLARILIAITHYEYYLPIQRKRKSAILVQHIFFAGIQLFHLYSGSLHLSRLTRGRNGKDKMKTIHKSCVRIHSQDCFLWKMVKYN